MEIIGIILILSGLALLAVTEIVRLNWQNRELAERNAVQAQELAGYRQRERMTMEINPRIEFTADVVKALYDELDRNPVVFRPELALGRLGLDENGGARN